MGFQSLKGKTGLSGEVSIEELHREECNACPLNNQRGLKHPKMEPTGIKKPVVYMLGEAPGAEEDAKGVQFIGPSGKMLRALVPEDWADHLRWNNVVRCRPTGISESGRVINETPDPVSIECCRPSIIRDIEKTKPRAIFGFGGVPLEWICGLTGIMNWRGRRMPIQVGTHATWFYPMLHPAFLLRQMREGEQQEVQRVFDMDLQRAFHEVEDLPPPEPHTSEHFYAGVKLLKNCTDIVRTLKWAKKQQLIALDYETNQLRPYSNAARVLTIAFSDGVETFAFGLDHPDCNWTASEREKVSGAWVDFIHNAEGIKVAHNLAFELEWTGVAFEDLSLVRAGRWQDTAQQACILDERVGKNVKPGCFALEFLGQLHFGFNLKRLSNVDNRKLSTTPLDDVLLYNALDAKYTALLWQKQHELIKEQGLGWPYRLASRRVPTVVLSQIKGVPVNQKVAKQLQDKYAKRIAKLEQQIAAEEVVKRFCKEQEKEFNPRSNPSVNHIFATMLARKECTIYDKRKHEQRISCNAEVLASIKHPLAKLLLALRKANKLKSVYLDPLLPGSGEKYVVHEDGLLHTNLNTFFAVTGRLTSSNPNLQQWPKRDEEAKEVRAPIEAPPGCKIVALDYAQIEARVIAAATQDKTFIKALWEDYDIHGEWAERIARAYPSRIGGRKNLTDKKIMKTFRGDVKNQWSFPLFFGCTPESASGYLKIPLPVIRPLFREFWKQFAGVKVWQNEQLAFYRDYGYVECLTGRRRRAPLSINEALNSPIQGTAAEIVMDAMSRLSETGNIELQPEINIHDDLTWLRVPAEEVNQHIERVLEIVLRVPFKWMQIVPVAVEVSVGANWMDMQEVGTYASNTWRGGLHV